MRPGRLVPYPPTHTRTHRPTCTPTHPLTPPTHPPTRSHHPPTHPLTPPTHPLTPPTRSHPLTHPPRACMQVHPSGQGGAGDGRRWLHAGRPPCIRAGHASAGEWGGGACVRTHPGAACWATRGWNSVCARIGASPRRCCCSAPPPPPPPPSPQPHPHPATGAQFWVGWCFHRGALRALRRGRPNMDVLVSVGTTAAYLYRCTHTCGARTRRARLAAARLPVLPPCCHPSTRPTLPPLASSLQHPGAGLGARPPRVRVTRPVLRDLCLTHHLHLPRQAAGKRGQGESLPGAARPPPAPPPPPPPPLPPPPPPHSRTRAPPLPPALTLQALSELLKLAPATATLCTTDASGRVVDEQEVATTLLQVGGGRCVRVFGRCCRRTHAHTHTCTHARTHRQHTPLPPTTTYPPSHAARRPAKGAARGASAR